MNILDHVAQLMDIGETGVYLLGGKRMIKQVALPLAIADVAFQAGRARRGTVLSTTLGATVGNAATFAGAVLSGPVGIAASLLGYQASFPVQRAVQTVIDAGSDLRHLNFGGNYRDTQTAYTMRQKAAQELSGSLVNARMYLGQEALLMHQ